MRTFVALAASLHDFQTLTIWKFMCVMNFMNYLLTLFILTTTVSRARSHSLQGTMTTALMSLYIPLIGTEPDTTMSRSANTEGGASAVGKVGGRDTCTHICTRTRTHACTSRIGSRKSVLK